VYFTNNREQVSSP